MTAPTISPRLHYIYVYHSPWTKEPVYVGKGAGRRAWDHIRRSHNKKLRAMITTAREAGLTIEPVLIETDLTADEAREREIFHIRRIGREDLQTGPLFNGVTSHGENARRVTVEMDGLVYESVAEFSRAVDVSLGLVWYRLRRNWTPRQIAGLEPPPRVLPGSGHRKGLLLRGMFFASYTEACAHFGIPWDNVKGRMKLGWGPEEAFLTPIRTPRPRPASAHAREVSTPT